MDHLPFFPGFSNDPDGRQAQEWLELKSGLLRGPLFSIISTGRGDARPIMMPSLSAPPLPPLPSMGQGQGQGQGQEDYRTWQSFRSEPREGSPDPGPLLEFEDVFDGHDVQSGVDPTDGGFVRSPKRMLGNLPANNISDIRKGYEGQEHAHAHAAMNANRKRSRSPVDDDHDDHDDHDHDHDYDHDHDHDDDHSDHESSHPNDNASRTASPAPVSHKLRNRPARRRGIKRRTTVHVTYDDGESLGPTTVHVSSTDVECVFRRCCAGYAPRRYCHD